MAEHKWYFYVGICIGIIIIGGLIGVGIIFAIGRTIAEILSELEIPGFEPFLLIGIFGLLAFAVIYRIHLKFKEN